MRLINSFLTYILLISNLLACTTYSSSGYEKRLIPQQNPRIIVGAERMDLYLYLLQNKSVAIVANQTSMVGSVHLVDTLLSRGIAVKKVFSPEHGFRGSADAGEKVSKTVQGFP